MNNAPDTEKSAEIVGRTFYRTLRKNGFSEKQIMYVAINMIDCLTDSLRGEGNRGNPESGKLERKIFSKRTDSNHQPFIDSK